MRDLLPPAIRDAVGPADAAALILLVVAWGAMGWLSEHPFRARPSVTVMMAEVRREWMREYMGRDNRIADAQIVASLRQGTAFFASTSLLAVGGVLALIGNVQPLSGLAAGMGGDAAPALLWQVRLLPCVLLLTHGFLKFAWANRVFGYCSVMMAAVPMDASDPRAGPRAAQAAELNVQGSANFNRGLRSLYYALASLSWLLGPLALGGAAVVVTALLARREFASLPRDILGGR